MKKSTQTKLERLASHLSTVSGKEITEVTNFISIAKKEAEKIGVNLHWTTLVGYEDYLIEKIRSYYNPPVDFGDLFKRTETPLPPQDKEVIKIKIMYRDGTSRFFIPQPEEKKEEAPTPEVVEEKWTDSGVWNGLFDYRGKKVFIRRGKNTGCEITSRESVLQHFRRWDLAFGWSEHQLRPDVFTKYFNEHTPKDLKTLMAFSKVCKEKRG